MLKRWNLKSIDPACALALASQLGVSRVTATVLAGRGIVSKDDSKQFLTPSFALMPDPFLLKGMAAAVERLCQARSNSEKVCVYGDYDVDGISSTALLVSFLRRVGLDFAISYQIVLMTATALIKALLSRSLPVVRI
jgi:single-stranded-DNA-specific exonuclease